MVKITAFGLLLLVALAISSSNASEGAPVPEPNWRSGYAGQNTPMDALGDFDEVAHRLSELLERLEDSCKLDASAKRVIARWFENTEEEYMDRWFGNEGKFTIRFSTSGSSQSTNPRYDREFREATRSGTTSKAREDKPQLQDKVLTAEETGQDHDIVWTVEMAQKNQQLVDIGDKRNGAIVALVDLVNEQAGTSAVPPGRHSMTLEISPGTRNGEAVWWYSLEVRGQSNKWSHNGLFTSGMLDKVSEIKLADGERDALNAELVQIYDVAGIAHYNPLDRVFNGEYHTMHDCLEWGCDKWTEGKRFPPTSMRMMFEYPVHD